ncbi:MAG: hypothetical protein WA188_15170 [Terriglobales bacterium]
MADEIIRQGPGFTVYRTGDWGPPVPYPAIVRASSVNHGFYDLRDHPELAAQIPEASRSVGLQAILRALNAPGSPFMSLGCEYRLNQRDGSSDGLTCYFHSYVDLTYRDPARHSSEGQMVSLAERFLQEVKGSQDAVFGFEIAVQRMKHFFGNLAGYSLNLGLSGYGRTEEQAAKSYEAGAYETAKAFTKLSRDNPI